MDVFGAVVDLSVQLCASAKISAFLWAYSCIRMLGFQHEVKDSPHTCHLSKVASLLLHVLLSRRTSSFR